MVQKTLVLQYSRWEQMWHFVFHITVPAEQGLYLVFTGLRHSICDLKQFCCERLWEIKKNIWRGSVEISWKIQKKKGRDNMMILSNSELLKLSFPKCSGNILGSWRKRPWFDSRWEQMWNLIFHTTAASEQDLDFDFPGLWLSTCDLKKLWIKENMKLKWKDLPKLRKLAINYTYHLYSVTERRVTAPSISKRRNSDQNTNTNTNRTT